MLSLTVIIKQKDQKINPGRQSDITKFTQLVSIPYEKYIPSYIKAAGEDGRGIRGSYTNLLLEPNKLQLNHLE